MKIALLGYGRMGRYIDRLATEDGDEVVLRIDAADRQGLTPETLRAADVAIEFSQPQSAVANIELCLEAGVPVVVGTTGWLEELPRIERLVAEREGGLFWASNFSVGVNVFFAAARRLSRLLGAHGDYRPAITETHHVHKLDAPSGTAITLAENVGGYGRVPIESVREGEVPGTHEVTFTSAIDTLSLRHEAHGREGFARGALVAARWLTGRRGVFTMDDLLDLG